MRLRVYEIVSVLIHLDEENELDSDEIIKKPDEWDFRFPEFKKYIYDLLLIPDNTYASSRFRERGLPRVRIGQEYFKIEIKLT
jgi:hypothetical protein